MRRVDGFQSVFRGLDKIKIKWKSIAKTAFRTYCTVKKTKGAVYEILLSTLLSEI